MNTIDFINQKIRSAKDLDFGTIFGDAIELFKKTWVQGLLAQLFMILIMLPFIIIIYGPIIAMAIAQEQNGGYDPEAVSNIFAGFSILYLIFLFFAVILLSAVSSAIGAGLYRVIKKIDHNETVTTKDLFHFVKGKYLGKLLGIMLVSVLMAIPAALLCYLPLLYVLVPLSYFMPVFAFNSHLSFTDIITAAFNLVHSKFLLCFGLFWVCYILLMVLSIVTCGLGPIFLAPFMYHPVYLIYKNVIGFGDQDEIKQIGEQMQ